MSDINEQRGPWKVVGRNEIKRTPWLHIVEDSVIWPDGHNSTWVVVEMKPAVGVVALDDAGNVHLVGQHRYAVDRYEWEVPAGGIDDAEDVLSGAQRELREETGLTALKWTALGATHPHNSSCDSIYYIYLAQDLRAGASAPEHTEDLGYKILPFAQLLEQCQTGECMDALTVIAAFRAARHLGMLRTLPPT